MRLIVSSSEDKASENIYSHLLDVKWKDIGRCFKNPVYRKKGDILVKIDSRHIYFNNIDKKVENTLEVHVDEVVFISKHSSKAGVNSLTVHPIGNYGVAKYGGKEGQLVPASPHNMTQAFHLMRETAEKFRILKDYDVSFEATHHGPYLETPTYYIEIGSDESSWADEQAGSVIAKTVLNVEKKDKVSRPVVICVGGGHYAPRFTELAKAREVSIGHMVPDWAMKYMTEESFEETVEKTPEVKYLYFDRSSTTGKERERVKGWARKQNIDTIRSSDLESR